jgi:hypothetical protein
MQGVLLKSTVSVLSNDPAGPTAALPSPGLQVSLSCPTPAVSLLASKQYRPHLQAQVLHVRGLAPNTTRRVR